MPTFGDTLTKLIEQFVEGVIAVCQTELASRQPPPPRVREERKEKVAPRRILRSRSSAPTPTPTPAPTRVSGGASVVREEWLVLSPPKPRRRVRRPSGERVTRPREAAVPVQHTIKFEVVPHPDRKGRRLILTKLERS